MFHAALDPFYLALTGILTVGWQLFGFLLVFFIVKSDVLTDAWSAINFFFLALLTLNLGAAYNARNILASIFVMIWAIRLGGFQLFRISRMGGDTRFDDMRGKFLNFAGFWTAQAIWVWTVSCECEKESQSGNAAHDPFSFGSAHHHIKLTSSQSSS